MIPLAEDQITIPQGVTVTLAGPTLKVKGPKGELSRDFDHPRIQLTKDAQTIVIRCEGPRRPEKALVGTWGSHVRNMLKGVEEPFQYTMKVVFSHFPIKAKVAGQTFVIENFLGERSARKTSILPGVKVEVKGDQVVVVSPDVEKAGQTAANIEQACKIKGYDPRVFQDGIYITEKPR
ncbi:MAG: 50S ribosomal protein L6 [Methanobacteriota archaeon]